MVDTEDLRLAEVTGRDGVEVDGGVEVLAERLLDDDLALEVGAEATGGEARLPEVLEDGLEDGRRRGDVENELERTAGTLFSGGDLGLQSFEGSGLIVAAGLVGHIVFNALPDVGTEFAAGELLDVGGRLSPELCIRDGLTAKANQMEVGGQEAIDRQVVQGGQQLAGGQVAGGAENDHASRLGAAVFAEAGEERMTVGFGHRSQGRRFPKRVTPRC